MGTNRCGREGREVLVFVVMAVCRRKEGEGKNQKQSQKQTILSDLKEEGRTFRYRDSCRSRGLCVGGSFPWRLWCGIVCNQEPGVYPLDDFLLGLARLGVRHDAVDAQQGDGVGKFLLCGQ